MKALRDQAKTTQNAIKFGKDYNTLNKAVKRHCKTDKKRWTESKCEEAEKAHKLFTKQYGDSLNVQSPWILMMTSVMDSLLPKATSLFPSIESHLMETEFSVDDHFVFLVKDVTSAYHITLKLHLTTDTITRNTMKNPIRQKYTKQIQFQNQ